MRTGGHFRRALCDTFCHGPSPRVRGTRVRLRDGHLHFRSQPETRDRNRVLVTIGHSGGARRSLTTSSIDFNPRPPTRKRATRRVMRPPASKRRFNPRPPPRKRATTRASPNTHALPFQSTPASEEAGDSRAARPGSPTPWCFNPRPPPRRRATSHHPAVAVRAIVSIHARLRGSGRPGSSWCATCP